MKKVKINLENVISVKSFYGVKSFTVFFLVRIFLYSGIRSVFSPNTGKYGLKKTPYLDTFHAVSHKRKLNTFADISLSFLNR